jgi:hypothetical protein
MGFGGFFVFKIVVLFLMRGWSSLAKIPTIPSLASSIKTLMSLTHGIWHEFRWLEWQHLPRFQH